MLLERFKIILGNRLLNKAINFEENGYFKIAIYLYKLIIFINPNWSIPFYNLGLLYKYKGAWKNSFKYNLKAVELTPENQAAQWNLGIAATALNKWKIARTSWNNAGLNYEINDEPTDFDLGTIPIRINPNNNGEVVWCKRLDPARVIIENIPLPESNHRHGDLLLTDGAPVGYRTVNEIEYPVLNELCMLKPSNYTTYSFIVRTTNDLIIKKLEDHCSSQNIIMEDWSTIRFYCKQCSEGKVHDNHDKMLNLSKEERRIAFATLDYPSLIGIIHNWYLETHCQHTDLFMN